MQKMTDAEISAKLDGTAGWSLRNGKLHREYKFSDFKHAIEFMMSAVPGVDKMNHHPEWANVYNRVTVDLVTHDAGGITQLDFDLAALLEEGARKVL
ncbi:MAG: 4a-hydroxytetrahydrobiopterin dehydratase [Bryobacterales bacterium]|nr:4a-hydroxytetrahydrobiopterin dehydratase [Bryobacterales bacterium]